MISFVKFSHYLLLVIIDDPTKHNNTSFSILQCCLILPPSSVALSFSSPGFLVIKLEALDFRGSDIAWCQEVERKSVCAPIVGLGAHTLSMLRLSLLPCCGNSKTHRDAR